MLYHFESLHFLSECMVSEITVVAYPCGLQHYLTSILNTLEAVGG